MIEGDDKVARRYRELAREEPPAGLDRAILAAAKDAVDKRSLSRRWAMPVSIAAVLVLTVGVTLRMQQEQPGIETAAPTNGYRAPPASEPAKPAVQPAPAAPAPEKAVTDAMRRSESPRAPSPTPRAPATPSAPAATPAPAAPAAPPPAAAPAAQQAPIPDRSQAAPMERLAVPFPAKPGADRGASEGAPAAAGAIAPRAKSEAAPSGNASESRDARQSGEARESKPAAPRMLRAATPEEELERIAILRREGRDAEANEALERFEREHPGYRIADETWDRVKPRRN